MTSAPYVNDDCYRVILMGLKFNEVYCKMRKLRTQVLSGNDHCIRTRLS